MTNGHRQSATDVNANGPSGKAGRALITSTGVCVDAAGPAGTVAIRQAGRYPSEASLSALAPGFGGFVRDEVERPVAVLGERVGSLPAEAAGYAGPLNGTIVRSGEVDAPMAIHRQAVAR